MRHRNVSCRPFGAKEFGLLQDKLSRFVLKIGWVAVLSKDAFNQNFDLGSGAFTKRPIDGDAFADLRDKFRCDHFQIVFAHDFQCAVVLCQSIVEGDLVVVQSEVDAALIGFVQLLGEFDQLFDDFLCCDSTVVICVQSFLQHLRELTVLNEAPFRSRFDFVTQQFRKELSGDVFVFEAADFGEELVG